MVTYILYKKTHQRGLSYVVKDGKSSTLPQMQHLGKHGCYGVHQPFAQPLIICVNLDLPLNVYRPQISHLLRAVFCGAVLKVT